MFFLVAEDFDGLILSDVVVGLAQLYDLVVLSDGAFFGTDHPFDDEDYIRCILWRLEIGLLAFVVQRTGHATAESFDASREQLGVDDFGRNVCGQRLLNHIRANAVEVHRVGDIVLHRFQLHRVGHAEFIDDRLFILFFFFFHNILVMSVSEFIA